MANDESEVSRLVDQLEREHSGEPWHGQPLGDILSGITHRQAAARPLAGGHTIWEIVLHLTAWKNEVRKRLGGVFQITELADQLRERKAEVTVLPHPGGHQIDPAVLPRINRIITGAA